jgi:Asp-tRNA(Asn)/Glu-tRNA(Gln) amidotransferase A subunit family amidase
LAIPLGLGSKSKLPVGCQIVSNHSNDHVCMAVAMFLEEHGVATSPSPF